MKNKGRGERIEDERMNRDNAKRRKGDEEREREGKRATD